MLDRERVNGADNHGTRAKLAPVIDAARQSLDIGMVSIVAFTTPIAEDRKRAQQHLDSGDFIQIYVKADEAVRKQRLVEWKRPSESDPDFYEEPTSVDLTIDTSEHLNLEPIVDQLTSLLRERGILR